MRYFWGLLFCACAAEVPYLPEEQEFEGFGEWGEGIPGFEIISNGVDTGGGGGGGGGGPVSVDGIYLGTYTVTIVRDNYGDTCTGSASVTIAVQDGSISVGQGNQILLDCGEYISMRFRGTFDEQGLLVGEITEETTFNFASTWTGVSSNNVLAGSFTDYLDSSQGPISIDGTVNASQ